MEKSRRILFALILALLTFSTQGAAAPWKWICYGDTRSQDSWHRQVMSSITTTSKDYAFIVNVGDVVDPGDSTASWNTWQTACNDVLGGTGQGNTPPAYMAVKGNHDEAGNPALAQQNWDTYLPGQQRYGNNGNFLTFDYHNARFVLLDCYSPLTGPQITLLTQASQTNPQPWFFVIFHEPIFAYGGHPANVAANAAWGPLLYQAGCDLIFNGHNHHYLRTVKMALDGSLYPPLDPAKGTAEIITGDGGAPENSYYTIDVHSTSYTAQVAYPTSAEPLFYGYTELTLDGNHMTLRHYRLDGVVMDTAIYTANPKPAVSESTAIPAVPTSPTVAQDTVLAIPNPGKGTVKFIWDRPGSSRVEIRIFNMTGETIAKINQDQPTGNQVVWKGLGMAPGIYFYQATLYTAGAKTVYPPKKLALQ